MMPPTETASTTPSPVPVELATEHSEPSTRPDPSINECGFHPHGAAGVHHYTRHHRTTNFSAIRAKAAEDLDAVEALQAEAKAAAEKSVEVGNRLADAVKRAKESHFELDRAVEAVRDAGEDVDVAAHLKRAAKLIG